MDSEQIVALAGILSAVLLAVVGVLHQFGRDVPWLSRLADLVARVAESYAAKEKRLTAQAKRSVKYMYRE